MITTAILHNPKPARQINWVGNPIPDGEDYWGNKIDQDAPPAISDAPTTRLDSLGVSGQRKRGKNGSTWTLEKRAEIAAKVKAAWVRRKAAITSDNG